MGRADQGRDWRRGDPDSEAARFRQGPAPTQGRRAIAQARTPLVASAPKPCPPTLTAGGSSMDGQVVEVRPVGIPQPQGHPGIPARGVTRVGLVLTPEDLSRRLHHRRLHQAVGRVDEKLLSESTLTNLAWTAVNIRLAFAEAAVVLGDVRQIVSNNTRVVGH
jgi:hypothetical protein